MQPVTQCEGTSRVCICVCWVRAPLVTRRCPSDCRVLNIFSAANMGQLCCSASSHKGLQASGERTPHPLRICKVERCQVLAVLPTAGTRMSSPFCGKRSVEICTVFCVKESVLVCHLAVQSWYWRVSVAVASVTGAVEWTQLC